ncbi:MAG: hypothetical protein QNK37_28305 [Acidobacteriota bacterium]|nr:hypothetical protein [Acidobacteriota bacterium]
MKKMKLTQLMVSSFITRDQSDNLLGGAVADLPYEKTIDLPNTFNPSPRSVSCCYITQTGC